MSQAYPGTRPSLFLGLPPDDWLGFQIDLAIALLMRPDASGAPGEIVDRLANYHGSFARLDASALPKVKNADLGDW